jgi:hypothetical protein
MRKRSTTRLVKAGLRLIFAIAIVSDTKADNTAVDLLKGVTHLFQHASRRNTNTVPDAVLNRTKCVVAIAALPRANNSRSGVIVCRDSLQRWTNPDLITFTEKRRAPTAALLVFILEKQTVQSWRSTHRLQIRQDNPAAAPLTNAQAPALRAVSSKLLAYQYATDTLSSIATPIDGVIRNRQSNPDLLRKDTDNFLSSVEAYFNTIRPTGIVFHHTATIPSENRVPRKAREVDEFHKRRGFEIKCSGHVYHEAYHFLIFPDGNVKKGRPETCEGAHAEGYNSYLGISLVGDFSSEDNPKGEKGTTQPSQKQLISLVQLCRRLKERYNIPMNHIVRHSDISHTQCPGDRFPFSSVLQQVASSK